MVFCKNCGTQMDENMHFCANCGTPVDGAMPPVAAPVRVTDVTDQYDPADIADNKWLAIFNYFGILTSIFALIAKPDSRFIKFHANQALLLTLLGFASVIVCIIPILGWIAAAICGIFNFVCIILGIINCCKGRAKELPLIGGIRIIR